MAVLLACAITLTGQTHKLQACTRTSCSNAVEAASVVDARSLNNMVLVDRLTDCSKSGGHNPCSNAGEQLNECVYQLADGGFCDARRYGSAPQQITAPVEIGSNRGSGKTITLLLDRRTPFICNFRNPNDACIKRAAGSSIIATGTVSYPNAGFRIASTASVSNVVLLEDNPDPSINLVGGLVEGISVFGASGATVSDALVGIRNALQITHVKNVTVAANGTTNAVMLKIYATSEMVGPANQRTHISSGNIELDNIQVDGGGGAGNRPVWIGCAQPRSLRPVACGSMNSVSFIGPSAIVHPGPGGIPIIQIESQNGASGTNAVGNINFYGTQIEASNSDDIGILDNGAESMGVYGLYASSAVPCRARPCPAAGGDVIRLAQPAGTALDGVVIHGVDNQGGWTNTITNAALGRSFSGTSSTRMNYFYTATGKLNTNVWDDAGGNEMTVDSAGVHAKFASYAIGALPAASSNKNAIVIVNDYDGRSATCAAGRPGVRALAVSDGRQWVCTKIGP